MVPAGLTAGSVSNRSTERAKKKPPGISARGGLIVQAALPIKPRLMPLKAEPTRLFYVHAVCPFCIWPLIGHGVEKKEQQEQNRTHKK